MRHGLMQWREDELSRDDVIARQTRMSEALKAHGLDALVVYTNHVRSAGVTYLTGFTPYWSDALLLLIPGRAPIFSTALSKRVGNWIATVNPTAEVGHSPKPGQLVGKELAAAGCVRVGVLELDQLPSGLADEITSVAAVEFVDASEIFAAVRAEADPAELSLASHVWALGDRALNTVDTAVATAGEAVSNLERVAREAGAEECYIAMAPDLQADQRPGRLGHARIGDVFAVRLSLAYNGVWIRRTRSFSRDAGIVARLDDLTQVFDRLAASIDVSKPIGPQINTVAVRVSSWSLEAPVGTLPLVEVASSERDHSVTIPYGILNVKAVLDDGLPVLIAVPVGVRQIDDETEVSA